MSGLLDICAIATILIFKIFSTELWNDCLLGIVSFCQHDKNFWSALQNYRNRSNYFVGKDYLITLVSVVSLLLGMKLGCYVIYTLPNKNKHALSQITTGLFHICTRTSQGGAFINTHWINLHERWTNEL